MQAAIKTCNSISARNPACSSARTELERLGNPKIIILHQSQGRVCHLACEGFCAAQRIDGPISGCARIDARNPSACSASADMTSKRVGRSACSSYQSTSPASKPLRPKRPAVDTERKACPQCRTPQTEECRTRSVCSPLPEHWTSAVRGPLS